jgi:eukaryotic-like serine/threonine-protein kinase
MTTPSETAESRVGTLLQGKWHLDAVLGIGGMATVYAATHRNKKRVAIKILHPEIAFNAEMTARFLREGYVANTVDHPGTVTVLDDDVIENGAAFLVMELLEGETIESRRERKGGQLPANEVLWLAEQVLSVLVAAHDKGVVHRDLKPDNLFLTTENRVKVLDFGIARLRDVSQTKSVGTQAGSLLGTPTFMAPEQARGRSDEVDARTDIWAVGATMFHLLTGRLVHLAETLNEQLIFAATQPAPSLGAVMPDLSPDLIEVVDRALAFEKSDRWTDAAAMLQAVRTLLEQQAPQGPLSVMPTRMHFEMPVAARTFSPAQPTLGAAIGPLSLSPSAASTDSIEQPESALLGPSLSRPVRRAAFIALTAIAFAASLGLVLFARSPDSTTPAIADSSGRATAPAELSTAMPTNLPPASAAVASAPSAPAAPAASVEQAAAATDPTTNGKDGASKPPRAGSKGGGASTPATPAAPTAKAAPTGKAGNTSKPAPTPTAPPAPTGKSNPFDRRFLARASRGTAGLRWRGGCTISLDVATTGWAAPGGSGKFPRGSGAALGDRRGARGRSSRGRGAVHPGAHGGREGRQRDGLRQVPREQPPRARDRHGVQPRRLRREAGQRGHRLELLSRGRPAPPAW